VALIVLLAQIGSFVPADAAQVGLVDRIFTRVGAHDDLAGGTSTFMVEMLETATICRQATPRSLVVLDEVGRGTSSEDGQAIAQAVLEYLHDRVGARTLFATHFHALASLGTTLPGLELWTFAVLELSGRIAFTHRLTPGVSEQSYGLHVARLAGLPEPLVDRARALLAGSPRPATSPGMSCADGATGPYDVERRPPRQGDAQSIRRDAAPLIAELARVDLAQTTPLQALLRLADVQLAARRLLEDG
jgi:DNA mismatch repair protein MutS